MYKINSTRHFLCRKYRINEEGKYWFEDQYTKYARTKCNTVIQFYHSQEIELDYILPNKKASYLNMIKIDRLSSFMTTDNPNYIIIVSSFFPIYLIENNQQNIRDYDLFNSFSTLM